MIAILSRASRIIVLSRTFRNALIAAGIPSERIEVVTTMFDGSLIKARERRASDYDRPALLFMARLVKEKGCYELIEAFAMLKDHYPGMALVMAGDGPELDSLKVRAFELGLDDRIFFPGYIRRQGKASAFDRANLFVFPSYYSEGLPNAVLEAMGAGLPILAYPIAAVPEVMDDPDNGTFLARVTPEDIATKLQAMLADPDELAATSKRNITKAWREYEANAVSRKIEAIYRAALLIEGHTIETLAADNHPAS